jgi:hypothetical protein
MPAVLADRTADRFAIADRAGTAGNLHPVAALQAGDDKRQMLVIDPAQAKLVAEGPQQRAA